MALLLTPERRSILLGLKPHSSAWLRLVWTVNLPTLHAQTQKLCLHVAHDVTRSRVAQGSTCVFHQKHFLILSFVSRVMSLDPHSTPSLLFLYTALIHCIFRLLHNVVSTKNLRRSTRLGGDILRGNESVFRDANPANVAKSLLEE